MVEDYIHQTYLVGKYTKCTTSDFFLSHRQETTWKGIIQKDQVRWYVSKSSGTFHLIKMLIAKRRTVKTSLSTLASATTHFRAMIAASTSHITSHHPA